MEKLNDNHTTYTYETKCRRCGHLQKVEYDDKNVNKTQFAHVMTLYTRRPPLLDCNVCGKQTFQDVVSY